MLNKPFLKIFTKANIVTVSCPILQYINKKFTHNFLSSSRLWRDPAEGGGKRLVLPLHYTPHPLL